jgi:hypothetical protein
LEGNPRNFEDFSLYSYSIYIIFIVYVQGWDFPALKIVNQAGKTALTMANPAPKIGKSGTKNQKKNNVKYFIQHLKSIKFNFFVHNYKSDIDRDALV